ncbi:MAG TPA: aldehyde dehydrogenase family protein [Thermomicrobiales bacterium]|nr:aldehyde dehydrogenase family protein [Thermomicrobiales bacterium]
MPVYTHPGQSGSLVSFQDRYDNFIGGEWTPPAKGKYFENKTPVTGAVFTTAPASTPEDIERALDAAWAAARGWGNTPIADRADILWKIADRIDANRESLAIIESWENGKPIRETLNADIPLAADHFRYFAAAIRAQESMIAELDPDTVSYHFYEPLGVVGQIIPWNFPILMAAWKLAPALAAGNAVVLKPASATPVSILEFIKVFADLLPPGVLNIVDGAGSEVGNALASNPRIRKVAFTGSTEVGRTIAEQAADLIIPVTLELGGKSPNIFFEDVASAKDEFYAKALEGLTLFNFNKGEVCSCPSRALVQQSIFDEFVHDAILRVDQVKQGDPLDTETQIGPQASEAQLKKILGYIDIGNKEGARLLTGGERNVLDGALKDGYYVLPTVFEGRNSMQIFQDEIFGPVLSLTSFTDFDDAIAIANDTPYGLGAGVWSRNGTIAHKAARAIEAGRVWTNCYHLYPAGAAFGGYKESGVGRETHKVVLGAYQQIKNVLVSYSEHPVGLF